MRYWIGNTEHIFLYKAQNRIRFVYEDDAQLENVWYPWLYVWVHIFGRCFYCGIRLYFVGKIHSQFYYGYVPCTQYSIHFVPIRRAFFLCKQTCLITKMFHSSSTKVFFLSFAIHTLYIMMLISLSFHRSLQTRIHFQGEQSSKCSYCAELWFVYAIFFNKHNDSFNCNWWYFNQFQRNNASWKLTFHDLLS